MLEEVGSVLRAVTDSTTVKIRFKGAGFKPKSGSAGGISRMVLALLPSRWKIKLYKFLKLATTTHWAV